MRLRPVLGALALAMLTGMANVPIASAQNSVPENLGVPQSQVLAIDSDRFFRQSSFGLRALAEFEAAGQRLDAENTRIAQELRDEEQALTRRRASLTAATFAQLADAFDQKVQRIRNEQSAKQQVIESRLELAERMFLQAALPVLENLMAESGAALIVEKRDVFIASLSIEITDQAIARINVELGDGLRDIAGQPPAEGGDGDTEETVTDSDQPADSSAPVPTDQ
ncbi:OmpH family outer membrane protein [Thalassobius sp. Cn5-15]|uniref:OmpH family outer membrane protein n=1 Tax=Thalassobius sp. Cn5-15 TaxID=2917763 RepID=UPI001EF30976|nr:OmpH family outer membrane protein [Thalassobius sp. Cn5-15]MCG7492598.1 OmpH family outer membrane protein [Thalassobius sp. Cn5-15]